MDNVQNEGKGGRKIHALRSLAALAIIVCIVNLFRELGSIYPMTVEALRSIEMALTLPELNGTTTASSRASHPHHPLMDSCMAEANRLLDSDRKLAIEHGIPVFSFISIAPAHDAARDNTMYYWITLNTKLVGGKSKQGNKPGQYASEIKWYCNNNQTIGKPVGQGCPHGHGLIIQCPLTETPLEILYGVPVKDAKGVNSTKYNLAAHVKCLMEEQEQQQRLQSEQVARLEKRSSSPADLRIGSCLIMRGDLNRARIKQFVAYHRLQGYDHFFIYLNEEYNHTMADQLPMEQSDVQYVPANLNRHIVGLFKYQQAMDNDCLHKCRAHGFDYCAMHDVDEYVQVVQPNTTLKEFLWPFRDRNDISGVRVHSVTWPTNNSTSLLLDNTIRDSTALKNEREKVFDKPNKAFYHSVHSITSGSGNMKLVNPKTELRMNHFRAGLRLRGKPVTDMSMYDAYRQAVVKTVNDMK